MGTGWLCGLLIALTLITLIGHGIWVFVASLFSAGKSPATRRAPQEAGDELFAAEVQINRLTQAGFLDEGTRQRVVSAINEARQRQVRPVPVLPVVMPAMSAPAGTIEPPATIAPAPLTAPSPIPTFLAVPPNGKRPIELPAASQSPHAPVRPTRPAPKPTTSARPFSEVVLSFMRQSNIRWGELIGGLLIVGCSVALVISFWNQIRGHAFFQFGIFTGVTAALMGLGLYAEHRWKLPTTSRGILLIATLLVPLNFLAFAALAHGAPPSVVVTAAEVGALGLFGALVWRAAAILAPYWPRLLSVGVIASSAALVIIRHLGPAQSAGGLLALGAIPIASYGAGMGAILGRARRWQRIRGHVADAIFLLLGVLTFGAALGVALVLFQTNDALRAARHLAPLLSLGTMPAMATGLLLLRRVNGRKLAAVRTAGTAIALAAAFLMVGTIALAWPNAGSMLPLAGVDFLALTLVAVLFEFPALHALAGGCLILAYLLSFHVARHHVGWVSTPGEMFEALRSPAGGAALIPLFLLTGVASFLLEFRKRLIDARIYRLLSIVVAGISLALTTWDGFGRVGDPFGATWVYLAYATIAGLVAWRWRRADASWAAWMLLLASMAQFLAAGQSSAISWTTGLLAYATVSAVVCLLADRFARAPLTLAEPARWLTALASAAGTIILLANLSIAACGETWPRIAWTAAIWIALALAEESAGLFALGQIALAVGAAIGVVSQLAHHAWFHQSTAPMLEPWTLQSIGLAVAVLCLGWLALRQALSQRLPVRRWLDAPWSVDRILSLALLAGLTLLCIYAVVPGIGAEFATHRVAATSMSDARAAGIGSWALLAVLLLTIGLWMRDRTGPLAFLLIVAMGCIACILCAAHWNDSAATASALRWAMSAYLLLVSAPLWPRQELPLGPQRFAGMARNARTLVFALTALPVLVLSIYPAALTLSGTHIIGPSPGSFFAKIGNAASYSVPLLLVGSACIGDSVRDRSPTWAFAGSLVLNLTTTLGYGLAVATSGDRFDAIHLIRLVQLNVITLAAFALAWQLTRSIRVRKLISAAHAPALLSTQVMAALGGSALLIAPAAVSLFALPRWGAAELATVGDPLGCVSLLMALGAAMWVRGALMDHIPLGAAASGLVALSLMLAFAASRWDVGDWRAYHVLMAGLSLSAFATLGLAILMNRQWEGWAKPADDIATPGPDDASDIVLQYQRHDPTCGSPAKNAIYLGSQELRSSLLRCLPVFTGILVLLALRAMVGDPQRPWWSVASTVAMSLLWTAIAWWAWAPRLLYAGGLLLNLAATMWCVEKPWTASTAPLLDLILANVAVLAFSGLAAMVMELQVFHRTPTPRASLPFHGFAAFVSTAAVVTMAGLTIGRDVLGITSHASIRIEWAAVASAALLASAILLWDIQATFASGQLYALGLAAIAIVIDGFGLPINRIGWAAAILLAGYVLLTGTISGFRNSIRRLFGRPAPDLGEAPRAGSGWLAGANLILSAAAIVLSVWVDFVFAERGMRLAAADAAIVQVLGLVLGARTDGRLDSRRAALWVGALAAVVFGWAWMQPATATLLDRSVAFMTALVCTIALYTFLAGRLLPRESLWSIATRGLLAPLAGICAIVLLEILSAEVAVTVTQGAVVMHAVAIGAVIAALVSGAAGCLALALNPACDPLQLPPARRGRYVYATEALLGLTFLHLRLTMPQLFDGLLAQYWPLMVMALAFAGVGLGEIFRRRRVLVLSDPLFRTGAFLPILPAIAYWLLPPSRVDYAYLLFTTGLFYAILSATRKSFTLGVLAALAANGGFWSLLAHAPQLAFFVHPQLWLIPAAVSVLVAAQLNADRLSLPQLRAIRYACLIVVYVSSTADVFLNGVSRAPWLPMVLAALSVAGVMLGILLRMRAFLVLGTAFLSLAVLTMIYYASANLGWTWLWYVAGIALGSGIIATFALFEKKRAEMVALVEGLKQWQ